MKVRWLDCGEACRKTNRQAIRVNTNSVLVLLHMILHMRQLKKGAII
jgi:hypothetical protein